MIIYKSFINCLQYLGSLFDFARETGYFLFRGRKNINSIIRELITVGVESVLLVSLITFFIGIIIAFQSIYQFKRFSTEIYISPLVALSIVRELGPVVGALIIGAKIGTSITAGIGAMKISEQIDALESFSVSPINFLVVPKLIALLISVPLLTIYADFMGILGGYVVGGLKFSIPFSLYFRMAFEVLQIKDIVSGFLKSFFFGGVIALVSCYEGFIPNSSEEISHVVTRTVVRIFASIIVIDCILTGIFYFFVI